MPIYLGAVMGGPEETLAGSVWRDLAKRFHAGRGDDERPFLNVVFHFPGSLLQPDYEGLRTAKFSKAKQGFMIQVAVPKSVADAQEKARIEDFMLDAIEQAIEMSRSRWRKHAIAFPFDKAEALVKSVRG